MGIGTTWRRGPDVAPGRRWALSLSLALTLVSSRQALRSLFDGAVELRHFVDRAVGMTTLAGVDASGYARGFVGLQVRLTVTFLVLFALLRIAQGWTARFASPLAPEHLWIARLSEIWVAIAVLDGVYHGRSLGPLVAFVGHLIALAFLVLVGRRLLARRWPEGSLLAADRHFVAGTLLWPVPFAFAHWAFAGREVSLEALPASVWLLLFLALWAGCLALVRRGDGSARLRMMTAAVPWLLVPASLVVANEVQARFTRFGPATYAKGAVLVLVVAAVALYLLLPRLLGWARRRPWGARVLASEDDSARWILHAVYFPVTVATAALFKFHDHKRALGSLDYFHFGEQTLPTHQLLEFGSMPLVDIRLAHTFSDMAFQTLYSLVHGVHGLEMMMWARMGPLVLGTLLCYYVLGRLMSPGYAFAAVLLLPVLASLGSYYSPVLLPAVFLARALDRPTTGRFVALFISELLLMAWRLDFGLAAGVAMAGVMGVHLLRGAHRRRACLRSVAAVASACVAAVAGLAVLRGPSALATLSFLLESYSYRLITRVRPEVIERFDLLAVLQYYLVPALALGYVLSYAARRVILRRYVPTHQAVLAFLAAFALVMSVRSMERHSLVEQFNPYFTVVLLGLLPLFASPTDRRRERGVTRAGFAAALVAYALFGLPPASWERGGVQSILAFHRGAVFTFYPFAPEERRVTYAGRHEDVVSLLRSVLEDDQTFFDFTNSPLLYVLADQRFPTYVIPNLIQTSETVQAAVLEDLGALRAEGRLPVVIFKQGSRFWDNTDDVPNEIRSYRVAEWIYAHYRPWIRSGSYELWWEKGRPLVEELADVEYALPLRDDPGLEDVERVGDEPTFLTGRGGDPKIWNLVDTSATPRLDEREDWSLEMDADWEPDGPMEVFFAFDGGHFRSDRAEWAVRDDGEKGPVSVLLPQVAEAERLTDVRFDPPPGSTFTVREVRLASTHRVRPALRPEELAQVFDLGRLPAVWARFDPLRAVEETPVVATLVEGRLRLEPGDELTLEVPALEEGEPPATYLHVEVRPAASVPRARGHDPRLRVSYGVPMSRTLAMLDAGPPEPVPESLFSFEVYVPIDEEMTRLESNPSPTLRDFTTFDLDGRTILQGTGPSPSLGTPFLVAIAGAARDDAILILRVAYRSRVDGEVDIVPVWGDQGAGARARTRFGRTTDHGSPEVFQVALERPGAEPLTDLRFDFHFGDGSRLGTEPLFEIVEGWLARPDPLQDDYLVRLTTQWRWSQTEVEALTLTATEPLIVERVVLRGGD